MQQTVHIRLRPLSHPMETIAERLQLDVTGTLLFSAMHRTIVKI
jgi:hypothetical protein